MLIVKYFLSFLETETYLNYNNVSNITSGAVEAYRDLFNDSTTRLTVVEDDTIPEYYINQVWLSSRFYANLPVIAPS